jgi:Short C-terminal domain
MVLLSNMMRAEAITGRTGYVDQWFAGRQFGRWVYQSAPAAAPPPADPAESLETLSELHERGVISDAELEALRRRIKAP